MELEFDVITAVHEFGHLEVDYVQNGVAGKSYFALGKSQGRAMKPAVETAEIIVAGTAFEAIANAGSRKKSICLFFLAAPADAFDFFCTSEGDREAAKQYSTVALAKAIRSTVLLAMINNYDGSLTAACQKLAGDIDEREGIVQVDFSGVDEGLKALWQQCEEAAGQIAALTAPALIEAFVDQHFEGEPPAQPTAESMAAVYEMFSFMPTPVGALSAVTA